MARTKTPIPPGMHTITPHLLVRDAAKAIEFYKRAFGAQEAGPPAKMPDGRIMHAALKFGDSTLFLNDEFPEHGGDRAPQGAAGTPVTIHLFVEDADAVFNRAVSAGAEVKMPIADQFWGDRYGILRDPFGHSWSVATHTEDLTQEEMRQRFDAFMAAAPAKD